MGGRGSVWGRRRRGENLGMVRWGGGGNLSADRRAANMLDLRRMGGEGAAIRFAGVLVVLSVRAR